MAALLDSTFGLRDSSDSYISWFNQCLVVQYSVFCFLVTTSGEPLIGTPCGASAVSHGALPLSLSTRQTSWEFFGIGDVSLVVHPVLSSSPVVCFTQALSQASFESYLARNLLTVVNLVVFHSIPFIFRTCPHYPFVCRAYDFPWLPPPLWSMDTVVRIGNLETPKGPTARFLTTIFCLFNLKIILE